VRSGLRFALAQHAGGALIDALMMTLRIHVDNEESYRAYTEHEQPVIFVLWHGRLLPLGFVHRGQGVIGLASHSADGEYIARLLLHWGFGLIRGSSSRGGDTAFRELVRAVKGGRTVAITPDGPRGPREQVKPGVLQLAQLTGAPLIPVAAASSRAWWFVSWDRFLVPQPFARLAVAYGPALHVPRDIDAAGLDRIATAVESELGALMTRVEARIT
jgi:lysophospholipid acyltransferase (LPLAT)-like uncharacterized protein